MNKLNPTNMYQALNDALSRASVGLVASEVHGQLSGMLCSPKAVAAQQIADQFLIEVSQGDVNAEHCRDLIVALVEYTHDQIRSMQFDYQLLLPDEEAPITERVEAFALWCQGFVAGIGLTGIVDDAKIMTDDMKAILADFTAFSQVDFLQLHADEAEELALMEIYEYARMAVLLLHQDISTESRVVSPSTETVH